MVYLELKKNRGNYKVNVFPKYGGKSIYSNNVENNPSKLAQVLIDLHIQGFHIEEAVQIFNRRIRNHDWMGI
jgi:hypothetical protein